MFIRRNRNQTSSFLGLCNGGFQTVLSSLILVSFHPTCRIPEWGWLPSLRAVSLAYYPQPWLSRCGPSEQQNVHHLQAMRCRNATASHHCPSQALHLLLTPWFYSRTSPIARRWCESDVTTQGLSLRVWEPSQKASSTVNLVITSSDIV